LKQSASLAILEGLRQGSRWSASVVGALTRQDREAIGQFEAEKMPPDYSAQIQQYLKNLADATPAHP
jgi:hypothetical protein